MFGKVTSRYWKSYRNLRFPSAVNLLNHFLAYLTTLWTVSNVHILLITYNIQGETTKFQYTETSISTMGHNLQSRPSSEV